MKLIFKIAFSLLIISIFSCAEMGFSPPERADAFVSDMREGFDLKYHFNTAGEMYRDVHNRDNVIGWLFPLGIDTNSITYTVSDLGKNKVDVSIVDAALVSGDFTFEMELELYSAFSQDYKIRRIISKATNTTVYE